MAQCKLNKILIVCEKWKRKSMKSDSAMQEIQNILDLKESEMPPCTCKPKESTACPLKSTEMASCPMASSSEKSGSCHTPGPSNISGFYKFYCGRIG